MGTRGFLGITAEGVTRATYNHFDSYPTGLGVDMATFVRDADLGFIAANVAKLVPVDEEDSPTSEQLADLKARGFWQDVSTGTDWYSALRSAQGNLAEYIRAGYFPSFDAEKVARSGDCFIEWGYLVDLDTETLDVYEYVSPEGTPMKRRASIPFAEIRANGFDAHEAMRQIEYEES